MSTPIKDAATAAGGAMLNGACQATGAYLATQYGIPAAKVVVKETAKKVEEVAEKGGYAALSATTCGAIGGAVAGPAGAAVGGFLGWMSGADSDKEASEKFKKTGEDDRCRLQ